MGLVWVCPQLGIVGVAGLGSSRISFDRNFLGSKSAAGDRLLEG